MRLLRCGTEIVRILLVFITPYIVRILFSLATLVVRRGLQSLSNLIELVSHGTFTPTEAIPPGILFVFKWPAASLKSFIGDHLCALLLHLFFE